MSVANPRMLQKFASRYAKVGVLLKTLHQEIFNSGRCSLREWRMIIIYYTEKSWHRLQFVVRRLSIEELNHCTTKAPNI
jgi:hypothetical protein